MNRGPPCATRRARCDAVASTRPTEHVGLWGALGRAASSIRGAVARRTSHARGTTMQHLRTGPFASSSAIAARRDWRSSQGDHGASARQTPRRFSRRAHPGAPLPCFRWTAEVPLLSGHRGYTCHLRLYSHLPGVALDAWRLHETEFTLKRRFLSWFGASFRRQRNTRRLKRRPTASALTPDIFGAPAQVPKRLSWCPHLYQSPWHSPRRANIYSGWTSVATRGSVATRCPAPGRPQG